MVPQYGAPPAPMTPLNPLQPAAPHMGPPPSGPPPTQPVISGGMDEQKIRVAHCLEVKTNTSIGLAILSLIYQAAVVQCGIV